MKYIYIALLISISGCSNELPNAVAVEYSGSDFDVLAQIADSIDPKEGWVFWVEGSYHNQDVGEKLEIISNCPTIMKIKAEKGVLTYELSESTMKAFNKKTSDACILNYANAIESRLSRKYGRENRNIATYEN